jgi:hypothetical protein
LSIGAAALAPVITMATEPELPLYKQFVCVVRKNVFAKAKWRIDMTDKELEDIAQSDEYELKLLELHKRGKITLNLEQMRKNVTMFRNYSLYGTGWSDAKESKKWADYYQLVLAEIGIIEKKEN